MENYSSRKLELLGLKWAITEKCKDYLYGAFFTVRTDNNPLSYLNTAKLGATEQRWVATLAAYNFNIIYRPGRVNSNADGLSRQHHMEDEVTISNVMAEKGKYMTSATPLPASLQVNVLNNTVELGPARVQADFQSSISSFPSLSSAEIAKLQQADPDIHRYLHYHLSDGTCKQSRKYESPAVKVLLNQSKRLKIDNGILYREVQDPILGALHQVVLPTALKPKILTSLHNNFGHQGEERTMSLVRRRCFWPFMFRDVKKWVRECERCSVAKLAPLPSIRNPLGHLIASKPLETIAIDFTLLERASDRTENVLIITDVF